MNKVSSALCVLLLVPVSTPWAADDVVPHSIRSLRSAGGDFLELVGPGKMLVRGKVVHYRKGKFIRSRHIDSLSEVEGRTDACVLHYATEDYSDNITVLQGCEQIMKMIANIEQPPQSGKLPIKIPIIGE